MKPLVDKTKFKIINEANEHEADTCQFFTGMYHIVSPTFSEISFIPQFEVTDLASSANIPQYFDDVHSISDARLITASFSKIIVSPNNSLSGTKKEIKAVTKSDDFNEDLDSDYKVIHYVSDSQFDDFIREFKEVIDREDLTVRSFADATLLLDYSFVNFIYKYIVFSETINSILINRQLEATLNDIRNATLTSAANSITERIIKKVFSRLSLLRNKSIRYSRRMQRMSGLLAKSLPVNYMTYYSAKNNPRIDNSNFSQILSQFNQLGNENWYVIGSFKFYKEANNFSDFLIISPNGSNFFIDIPLGQKNAFYEYYRKHIETKNKKKLIGSPENWSIQQHSKCISSIVRIIDTNFEKPFIDPKNNIYSSTWGEIIPTVKELDSKVENNSVLENS